MKKNLPPPERVAVALERIAKALERIANRVELVTPRVFGLDKEVRAVRTYEYDGSGSFTCK